MNNNENKTSEQKPQSKSSVDLDVLIKNALENPELMKVISAHIVSNTSKFRIETYLKYTLAALTIIATAALSYTSKLDPTMGVISGSILGYLFSKKDQ
ncbi:hypothetical protein [Photobacterium damselae]|uniref:hypothetical protein n=1 Tax=Photobacterium damselae TaxID=38293 RepID=UPI0011D16D22|nr:hypothetical protein [Photobacterium damselae]KAB1510135.1 hypothetical protein FD717_011555 [Photobacterium damselae subsp. damselae]